MLKEELHAMMPMERFKLRWSQRKKGY